jgi:hypothetical protein
MFAAVTAAYAALGKAGPARSDDGSDANDGGGGGGGGVGGHSATPVTPSTVKGVEMTSVEGEMFVYKINPTMAAFVSWPRNSPSRAGRSVDTHTRTHARTRTHTHTHSLTHTTALLTHAHCTTTTTRSDDHGAVGVLVLVPGLTDGLLCPRAYAAKLAAAATSRGWAFTQALLSSSYLG